ncbi:hypothetical protein ACWEPC_20925 [Nonomuraea sp. NPDC004297]
MDVDTVEVMLGLVMWVWPKVPDHQSLSLIQIPAGRPEFGQALTQRFGKTSGVGFVPRHLNVAGQNGFGLLIHNLWATVPVSPWLDHRLSRTEPREERFHRSQRFRASSGQRSSPASPQLPTDRLQRRLSIVIEGW